MKALIVTADDFGLAVPVNEAVEESHRRGVLSAASLMVGAPAMSDAVARARVLPALGVGLHLTLVDGRPVLPPEDVPGLIGTDGRFSSDPIRFGVALFLSRRLARQARLEINAQFDRFRETGLPLDHVNGHQHFHLHPVVARAIAAIAPDFGSPPVRVPVEPFRASYAANGDRPLGRFAAWLFYALQTRGLRRRLSRAGLTSNDHVFGLNDSGAMTERRVLAFLDHLPDGVSELYCHPATRPWTGADNLPADYLALDEFAALISPAVKEKIEALEIRPVSYGTAMSETGRRRGAASTAGTASRIGGSLSEQP